MSKPVKYPFIDQEQLSKEIAAKKVEEAKLKKSLREIRATLKNLNSFLENENEA